MDLTEAENIHRWTVQKRSSLPRKWQWCDHSPRARDLGMWSQVGLRKHHHEIYSGYQWMNAYELYNIH